MLTPSNIGIVFAVLSVIIAYWLGHQHGFHAGQERGYGDGKRDGSREGAQRGFAVGFDRARRERDGADGGAAQGVGFGVVAILVLMVAIFLLASNANESRRQQATQNPANEPYTQPLFHTDVPPATPELQQPPTQQSDNAWRWRDTQAVAS